MTYTNVSCFIGDDTHLIDLLKVLAVRKGSKVGQLVRKAIDEAYAEELEELRPIFFANTSARKHKSEQKSTKPSPQTKS